MAGLILLSYGLLPILVSTAVVGVERSPSRLSPTLRQFFNRLWPIIFARSTFTLWQNTLDHFLRNLQTREEDIMPGPAIYI